MEKLWNFNDMKIKYKLDKENNIVGNKPYFKDYPIKFIPY